MEKMIVFRIISHMVFMVQVIGLKKLKFSELSVHEDITSRIIRVPAASFLLL